MKKTSVLFLSFALLAVAPAFAQTAGEVANHAVPIGRGPGAIGFGAAAPGPSGTALVSNGAGSDPTFQTVVGGGGGGSFDNLLPNANMQQNTGVVLNVKQNSLGTAQQLPAVCQSFSVSNGNPTFNCTNTAQIAVGDLVVVATGPSFTTQAYDAFWGFAGPGYISCNANTVACTATLGTTTNCTTNTNSCYLYSARVFAVVTNTSISITAGLGGVSPASSSATYLFPIIRGDTTGGQALAQDGWTKTNSLICAPDDFAAHSYPGAIRSMFCRGGVNGTESVTWTVPNNQLGRFRGRTLSCGVVTYQTVQGGSATWNISISDGVTTSNSPNGLGVSAGAYQFASVTQTIDQGSTSISVRWNKLGNAGDVLYWALPTCGFVSTILQSQLHQNAYEEITADTHCNPPLLTPIIVEFMTLLAGSGTSSLYGYTAQNLEALSLGCYHSSLTAVKAKNEWTTATASATLLTGTSMAGFLFGPQQSTSTAGNTSVGLSPLVLDQHGNFILVTNTQNLIPISGTFDFWNGISAMPSTIN
jgi:hypothetical protein